MKFLNYFAQTFGFLDFTDFSQSFIHHKFLLFTMPSAVMIGTILEKLMGISTAMVVSFVVLAFLEIVTGISAAKYKGIKIESKKFSRFGLKIFVWLSLMFVVHSFAIGYGSQNGVGNYIVASVFLYLHSILVCYVSFEYLISVIENLSVLTGQSNNKLITILRRKFNSFVGEVESSDKPKDEITDKP